MSLRKYVWGFLVLSLLGLISGEETYGQVLHSFEMAVDTDNSAATGCDFVVTDANLPGVADPGYEVLVTLTVDSGQSPPMVIAADLSDCNVGSGSFEFSSSLPGAPWLVGLNNGEASSDVVEGFLPLTFPTADQIRLGFRSLSDSGAEDALITVSGGSGDPPIVIGIASLIEIPTLSAWGLALLILAMAIVGLGLLKRRRTSLFVSLIALALVAGLVYAAVPDGMVDEWLSSVPIANDPVPDASPASAAAEIVAAFAAVNGGDLCFRLDIADLENSAIKALDDVATVDEDVVSAVIDVLANDIDPDPGDTLTIIQVDSPTTAGGTAVIDPLATPDNRILYTPPADFNGSDSFTYTVEESGGGLTDMAMVTITVDPVNDAPILDNTGAMVLTAIDEDTANPAGDLVSGIIASAGGDRITDVDTGAVEGLAFIALDNSDGAWEFSTNGGGLWTPFGALSEGNATVLSATGADRVRFVPNADFSGQVVGIMFRAWDTTSGEASGTAGVDVSVNGGTSAFSLNAENASIDVNPINDAPVKTAGGGGPAAFTEDGGPVAVDPAVTVTDIDSPNLTTATVTITNLLDIGLETLAATPSGAIGAGDISYTAPTLTIAPVGGAPIADFQAVLQSVTYDNSSQDPDTTDRVLNCVANDGAADSNILAPTVTVAAENDAPELDNSGVMSLPTILEDATDPAGVSVAGLIASAGGDRITDVDGGAVEGIAVTARDNTDGTWQFSTNGGGAWTPFGALSDASATVLSDTAADVLRFVPAANFEGTVDPGITFRAWDRTSGEASGTPGVDASTNGGTTAFSTALETASITVTSVNDAPVKTAGGGGPAAFTEGGGPVAIDPAMTVTDADSANLVSATVTLTNLPDTGLEFLAATPSGAIGAGAITYVAPVLTIAPPGGAPVADFQAVLRSVTYNNTSTTPDETNRILNCVATDGIANSNTLVQTVTVTGVNAPPIAGADSYDTLGNTEVVVGTGGPAAVSLATVDLLGASVLDNDSDPDLTAISVVSATGVATDSTGPTFDVVTTNGGAVSMDVAGRFTYLPPKGSSNTTDSFSYGIQDADGGPATGTVTINIANARVWYVHNDPAGEPLNPVDGPNNGRSDDPFDALASASAAHGANDLICVYRGDGTTAGMNAGITLAASNVTLHGEHQGCEVNLSLNGLPAPEILLAPTANSHALIGHTAGDAISVDATAAAVTGIEIRGVGLSSTGGNALDVTSAGANAVGVLFENSFVSGASSEGIDVNHASSGTATVQVNNLSSLAATGNGFDARVSGAGDLEIGFDDVADITSGAGAGSAVFMEDVSGAGTLFVTSFSGSTVLGTSAGDGVQILGAVFDADPSDADFDLVSAGDLNIGIVSDRVGRSGVILGTPASRVSGNLSFGTLNAFTNNGPALFASGNAISAGGPPPTTGFLLTVATGIADAIGGPAVSLDPLTANVQLANISSTGSPLSGVSLVDVDGTVTLQAGGLTNSAGATFFVMGGTVTATYSGGIVQANNAPAVSVTGGHSSGIVTFDTGTVSATNGTGLQFDNADGTYNFNGTTTLNGGDAGIDILNGSGGTFTFAASTSITNPTGTGFLVNGSAPTLDYNGTVADTSGLAVDVTSLGAGGSARFDGQVTSSGTGLRVNGAAGTVDFANADLTSGATVDIDNSTAVITFSDLDLNQTVGTVNAFDISGGSANVVVNLTGNGIRSSTANRLVDITGRAGGTVSFNGSATLQGTGVNTGINITGSSAANTVAFNAPVDAGLSGNRLTGGAGVNIDNNGQAGALVSFANLDVFTNGQTALRAVNGGMANSTTGSLNALTGQGVEIDAVDTGMTFSSVTTTGSGAEGVQLTNLRDGASFAVTGTTNVTGATTRGISISSAVNAAIDLDFTGTTTVDNAGAEALRVDRADTNADPTGSDIDFGPLTINNRNTTAVLLDNVEGTFDAGVTNIPNPNAAAGYGIRVEDSSAMVTFATANISNTVQGIATTDGGGGVPGNDGDGDAIFLRDNTGFFTLNGGLIQDLATDGIDIRSSGNLTLDGVTIEDIGTASANPATLPDCGICVNNLRGVNLIRNSVIQRAQTDDIDELIRMRNNGQSYDELRINNTDFINTTIGTSGTNIRAANGVRIENRGTVNGTVIIENGSQFTGIRLNALAFLNGDGSGSGNGNIHLVVDDATLTGPAPVVSGGVIQIGGGNDLVIGIQDDYTVNYNVMNTTLQDIQVAGTLAGVMSSITGDVSTGGPGPSVTGRWVGNTLDDIRGRRGINLISEGDNQAYSMTIADNSIQDLRQEVISGATFFAREAIAISTRDDATNRLVRIVNNNVGAGPDGVIQSTGGTVAGDDLPVSDGSAREALDFLIEDNSILTALVHNNAFLVGAGGSEGFEIDVENSTTLHLTFTDNDIAAELDVNSAAEELFLIDTEAATASARLDLDGNTATLSGQEWEIDEGSGPITIENRATVTARNTGSFNFLDTIDDNGGDVVRPGGVILAQSGRISQIATVSTAFSALEVRVLDSNGEAEAGVTVNFAAPGAGASGTFPGGNTCVTNASGICSVAFTANAAPGAFRVTATGTVEGTPGEPAVFYLRNLL